MNSSRFTESTERRSRRSPVTQDSGTGNVTLEATARLASSGFHVRPGRDSPRRLAASPMPRNRRRRQRSDADLQNALTETRAPPALQVPRQQDWHHRVVNRPRRPINTMTIGEPGSDEGPSNRRLAQLVSRSPEENEYGLHRPVETPDGTTTHLRALLGRMVARRDRQRNEIVEAELSQYLPVPSRQRSRSSSARGGSENSNQRGMPFRPGN